MVTGSDVIGKSIIFSCCGQEMLPEEQNLNSIIRGGWKTC